MKIQKYQGSLIAVCNLKVGKENVVLIYLQYFLHFGFHKGFVCDFLFFFFFAELVEAFYVLWYIYMVALCSRMIKLT